MNFVVLFGTKIHEVYVDLYVDLWARTLAFYPRRVVEGPYPTWLVFKIITCSSRMESFTFPAYCRPTYTGFMIRDQLLVILNWTSEYVKDSVTVNISIKCQF